MTEHDEEFTKRKVARRKELEGEATEKPLRIAVLGPNLGDADNVGARKRRQIADALREDGHETFFPEQYVAMDDPFVPWVEQERQLLSDSDVDLVVILHTEGSAGVLVELGNFVSVPEISFKTGVLFPFQYYRPTQSLSANTAQAYFSKLQYTAEELESCQLVAECRRWAYNRKRGVWPVLPPKGF